MALGAVFGDRARVGSGGAGGRQQGAMLSYEREKCELTPAIIPAREPSSPGFHNTGNQSRVNKFNSNLT